MTPSLFAKLWNEPHCVYPLTPNSDFALRDVECGFGDAGGMPGHERLIDCGPVIPVQIGYDPGIAGAAPQLGPQHYWALIDTGATTSCVDSALAEQLGLRILDSKQVWGIGGAQVFNSFLAQVHVPSLRTTIWGSFDGVHLSAGGPFKALLGREFLARFKMVYEGWTGSVRLTPRFAISSRQTP